MEIVARAATFKKTSGWVGDGEDSKKKNSRSTMGINHQKRM